MKTRTKITIGILVALFALIVYTIISRYEHTDVILRLIELTGFVALSHHGSKALVDIKESKYAKRD